MKKLFIILFALISNNLMAQGNATETSNPRINRPIGISINLGGPSLILSASLSKFVNPNVNIEGGMGFFGFFGGAKYHFSGEIEEKNWTPTIGVFVTYIPEITFFNRVPSRVALYVPVGIQYLSNNGFSFGAEFAGLALVRSKTNVWGAIKLGYHF